MKKRFLPLSLALLLVLGLLVPGASAAGETVTLKITGTYNYDDAWAELELLNQWREENHLDPLTLDADLTRAAMVRAGENALLFGHLRPDGSRWYTIDDSYGIHSAAENVAIGYKTYRGAFVAFQYSEGHNANMLNPEHKSVGIGVFTDNAGNPYFSQIFSKSPSKNPCKETAPVAATASAPVAEQNISLQLYPDRLTLAPGESQTVYLRSTENLGYLTGLWPCPAVSLRLAITSDPEVVTASMDGDGVILTAHRAGTAVVDIGPTRDLTFPLEVTVEVPADPQEPAVTLTTYTLTYSTGTAQTVPSQTVTDGYPTKTFYLSPTSPVREGYRFQGWSDVSPDASPNYRPGGTLRAEGDVTLYAVWKKNLPVTADPDAPFYAQPMLWAEEEGFLPDGFDPLLPCTRAQAIELLWLASGEPTGGASPFTDVPSSASYAPAVAWAVAAGITTGTSDTTFSPQLTMTRAQVVTLLFRHAGSPKDTPGWGFYDVPSDAYFAKAVRWASGLEITNGTGGGAFSPHLTCTQGEILTFYFRYFA